MANTSTAVTGPLTLLYAADVARWYTEMTPHILRILTALGPVSARESEDVLHDAFISVMKHAPRIAAMEAEERRQFVFTIAVNRMRDVGRSLTRVTAKGYSRPNDYLSSFSLDALDVATSNGAWLAHAQPEPDPAQTTSARETLRAVWDTTPHEHRELLRMVMDGHSRTEIAVALACSESAVSTRLYRLRAFLIEAGVRIS